MGWQVATANQQATDCFGGEDLQGGVLADSPPDLTMLAPAALADLFA